jgi:hypothetical protein
MSLVLDAKTIKSESDIFKEGIATAATDTPTAPTTPSTPDLFDKMVADPLFEEVVEESLAEADNETTSEDEAAFVDYIYEIDMPDDCKTVVMILLRQTAESFYSGFHIVRKYETSPHEVASESEPSITAADSVGFTEIGDCVADGVERACSWIALHSDDTDDKAGTAIGHLESWLDNFDFTVIDESQLTAIEPPESTGATESTEAIESADSEGEPATQADASTTTTDGPPDEHQIAFDEEKHRLEEIIGKLAIERVRLKAATKSNRESIDNVTDEYESHLRRGVVRPPAFEPSDSSALPCDKHDPDDCTCSTCAQQRVDAENIDASISSRPDGSCYQGVTVEALGIDSKICLILRDENDIGTLGQIAEFCEKYELTDLKKIGAAKAEKIQEAMDAYWKANPQG